MIPLDLLEDSGHGQPAEDYTKRNDGGAGLRQVVPAQAATPSFLSGFGFVISGSGGTRLPSIVLPRVSILRWWT